MQELADEQRQRAQHAEVQLSAARSSQPSEEVATTPGEAQAGATELVGLRATLDVLRGSGLRVRPEPIPAPR